MAGLCEGGNEPAGSLKAISPAECEVLSVIKFLNAEGIAPIEIDRQLCQVYGPNVMSRQMVRCSTWSPRRAKTEQLVTGLTATCRSRGGRSSNLNGHIVWLAR
ncbi:hypothetical protein ANN_25023 [Periplaneta americana]|uniref:Uncharacterized protein n=1 Tax=Periplaneta americana TaxID=6978 RepID=A0ABQ8S0T6_PERAM|nr:hypothetical protein ANN_25023 [Periplaneta americana]